MAGVEVSDSFKADRVKTLRAEIAALRKDVDGLRAKPLQPITLVQPDLGRSLKLDKALRDEFGQVPAFATRAGIDLAVALAKGAHEQLQRERLDKLYRDAVPGAITTQIVLAGVNAALVAVGDELAGARRRQRDTMLVGLELRDDGDLHARRSVDTRGRSNAAAIRPRALRCSARRGRAAARAGSSHPPARRAA